MPAIYHEGSWLGNATDPEVLVKDTVGWTGKNLLKNKATTQTINGVTFTVNADKSVTVNGTATADAIFVVNDNFVIPTDDYILSTHEISDGNNIHYSVVKMPGNAVLKEVKGTDEQPFTVNYSDYSYLKFTVWVRSGTTVSNKTAYPMIRRADITDPTYEPYHESVEEEIEQIYADNGVLGAKNLLPKFSSGTDHGVTYTVDGDGVVTGNGTASESNSTISVIVTLKAGNYILNGCPSGGSTDTYRINAYLGTSPYTNYGNDTGEGLVLSFNTDTTIRVQIVVKNGATINSKVFKPMLRLASDPDDTYQPYAMTNKELTEKKINIADLKTVVSASSDFADFKTRIASL